MVSGSSRWLPLTETEMIWRCGAGAVTAAGGWAPAAGAAAGCVPWAMAGVAMPPSTVPTSSAAQNERPLGKTLFAVTRPRLHSQVGASPGPLNSLSAHRPARSGSADQAAKLLKEAKRGQVVECHENHQRQKHREAR